MAEDKRKTIAESDCEGCESKKYSPSNSAPVCEEKGISAPVCEQNDTLFSTLAEVSVKTLYYLLLTLSVLAVFISQLFPYLSMRFYYDFAGYETAVAYAKKYAKTGGDKRTEVLLYGIEMSEALVYESATEKNAEYLLYFTEEFLCLPSAEFEERCAALDDYYQSAYKESKVSLLAAVGLYSFKDYAYCKNVAARSVLGKANVLPYDKDFGLSGQAYITVAQLEDLLASVVDGDYTPDLVEMAIILNQLSENMAYGGSFVYDFGLLWVTTLYRFAAEIVAPVGGGYNYLDECQKATGIEKLYLVSAAVNFSESAIAFFKEIGVSDESESARKEFVIESGGETITISEYYGELLKNYK